MKSNNFLVLFLITMIISLPIKAIGNDDKGRMPPGVQIYQSEDMVEEKSFFTHSIFTNDDPKKITAFYRKTLGMDSIEERRFYLGDVKGSIEMESGPVYVWVQLASERKDSSVSESDLFEFLEDEMQKNRMMGSERHSDQQFRQVKGKYAHLAKGWYPGFDAKEKLHNCKNERERNIDDMDYEEESEVDASRIQALIAQGRQDEAIRLANKSAQAGLNVQNESVKDYWDNWISCLKEIDRRDYQVQIHITMLHGKFIPATEVGRKQVIKRPNEQKSGRGDRESQKESSNTSDELMNQGLDKLKGIFGL